MPEKIKAIIQKNNIFLKYLLAGGTAAAVDLSLVYIFTDFFHVWYLVSATLSYLIAFFVSFCLQKFWTFSDKSRDGIYNQLSLYLVLNIFNIFMNAVFMYILVDSAHVWYIYAKIAASGLIAVWSFIIYRSVIFKIKEHEPVAE
jgi:putative flippase GtrA